MGTLTQSNDRGGDLIVLSFSCLQYNKSEFNNTIKQLTNVQDSHMHCPINLLSHDTKNYVFRLQ